MLYKQMQVKEIPIIFRGPVEVSPGMKWENNALNDDAMPYETVDTNWAWFVMLDIDVPFTADKITVTYNEQEYVLNGVKKHYDDAFTPGEWVFYNIVPPDDLQELPYNPEILNSEIPLMFHGVIPDDGGDPSYSFYFLTEIDPDSGDFLYENAARIEAGGDPAKKIFSAELTGNGQIKRFHARFACGENGTLHINPYVILNGNITVNLCDFAKEGENYISGDNEDFTFDCYVPIETHAMLYVEAENVGEYDSMLDVAIVVQYEDFIEEESIVGYEGINLRRNHR